MRPFLLTFAAFALLPTFATAQSLPATAEELPEAPATPASRLFTFPRRVHLTSEQEVKLMALQKEYAPKLDVVQKEIDAVMTPERRAARAEARKKAVAEGKTDAERSKAVQAAAPLSREERKKFLAAIAAKDKLLVEVRQRKLDLLTEEQRGRLDKQQKIDM